MDQPYPGRVTSDEWLPPPPPAGPPTWVDPPRRSRRPVVVAIVTTAIVAAVVAVIGSLVFGGDDEKVPSSDVAAAFERIDGSLSYGVDGYVELTDCPVGDPRRLAEAVADVVEIDDLVIDGEVYVDAYERSSDYPAITQCFVSSDPDDGEGPTSIGFSVSSVPRGSYRDFLAEGAYGAEIDVSIDVQRRRNGGGVVGDVFGYCYRGEDLSGCGADVVDRANGVVLSVYLQGTSRTADEVVRALDEVVAAMAENLIEFAESNPVPSTLSGADT